MAQVGVFASQSTAILQVNCGVLISLRCNLLIWRRAPKSCITTDADYCYSGNLHYSSPGQGGHASAVQSRLLVQQGHRIGGPVTLPKGQAATDGLCDEILSCSHAFSNRFLVGQTGRNGRGEDTTAPVRVLGVDALGPELGEITPVVKNVGGYALEVAALHDDV